MSVKVDLNQLTDALTDYTFAYLVTVDNGYKAHTVAVDPVFAGGVINVGPVGGSTRRNVTAHSDVTLVWPPARRGDYTLIVDGKGQPAEADSPLQIVPSRAVLHRKAAPGAATKPGCKDDCVPLEKD